MSTKRKNIIFPCAKYTRQIVHSTSSFIVIDFLAFSITELYGGVFINLSYFITRLTYAAYIYNYNVPSRKFVWKFEFENRASLDTCFSVGYFPLLLSICWLSMMIVCLKYTKNRFLLVLGRYCLLNSVFFNVYFFRSNMFFAWYRNVIVVINVAL